MHVTMDVISRRLTCRSTDGPTTDDGRRTKAGGRRPVRARAPRSPAGVDPAGRSEADPPVPTPSGSAPLGAFRPPDRTRPGRGPRDAGGAGPVTGRGPRTQWRGIPDRRR